MICSSHNYAASLPLNPRYSAITIVVLLSISVIAHIIVFM